MFAESMLEVTWAQRSRRSWTTLTSFALQAMVISLLLLLPLWKTVVLPAVRMVSIPISMGRPDIRQSAAQPHGGARSTAHTDSVIIPIIQPGRVPRGIPKGPDTAAPEPPGGGDGGIPGVGLPGIPSEFSFPISGPRPVLPTVATPNVLVFRTSSVLEGSLVRRVMPEYPYPAKLARVQGEVVLAAIISKAGTIESLQLVRGHPLLVGAAVEAVRRWRYRPYILDGEPIEVETRITVNFTLSGS